MVTIDVWKSFKWTTLTLTWHARRADTTLSPHAAIRQAVVDLEDRGASVAVGPTGDGLTFRRGWFTGRTWLAYIWNGRLHVTVADGRTTAAASASVAPGVLLPPAVFLGFYVSLKSLALIMSPVLLIMVPWIYLVCSNGIETIATAALKPGTGDRAA